MDILYAFEIHKVCLFVLSPPNRSAISTTIDCNFKANTRCLKPLELLFLHSHLKDILCHSWQTIVGDSCTAGAHADFSHLIHSTQVWRALQANHTHQRYTDIHQLEGFKIQNSRTLNITRHKSKEFIYIHPLKDPSLYSNLFTSLSVRVKQVSPPGMTCPTSWTVRTESFSSVSTRITP